MSDYKRVELCSLASGAAVDKFDKAFREVLDNIDDPNTDAEKPRTITLTITVTPDGSREQATIEVQAKTGLAPHRALRGTAYMRNDGKKLVAMEHNFRQGDLFPDNKPAPVASIVPDRQSQAAGDRPD